MRKAHVRARITGICRQPGTGPRPTGPEKIWQRVRRPPNVVCTL